MKGARHCYFHEAVQKSYFDNVSLTNPIINLEQFI